MISEEDKIKYRKSIGEFRLIDDTFMAVVFGGELQLSEMLLHTTIGNDKIRVIKSIGQYAIKNLQGIRLPWTFFVRMSRDGTLM